MKTDDATRKLLEPMTPYFAKMAGATATAWASDLQPPPRSATFTAAGCEVFVDLAEHFDPDAEKARGETEREKLLQQIDAKEKKLSNENFVSRAPADVVKKERESLSVLRDRLQSTEAALAELSRG